MLDHWPIDVLGARMTLVSEGDLVSAVKFTFQGQPVSIAPTFSHPSGVGQAPLITMNDPLLVQLRQQVRNGFSFIQALFPIQVEFDRTDAQYEGETPEEIDQIAIRHFTYNEAYKRPLSLTYDFFTRAMMAAELPHDERYRIFASLNSFAREASNDRRYIDAFRYYFLILDAFFSNGQFKKIELIKAFKSHTVLMQAIEDARIAFREDRTRSPTQTGIFMRGTPTSEEIVKHIVERRGHYFHSNRRKSDAWSPDRQDEARDLSWLCSLICFNISGEFSEPIFAESFEQRHYDEAQKSGAIIVLKIDFTFMQDDDETPKQGRMNFTMPGTKPTRKLATEMTRNFVSQFIESHPTGSLMHVICHDGETNKPIFEIKFPKDLP